MIKCSLNNRRTRNSVNISSHSAPLRRRVRCWTSFRAGLFIFHYFALYSLVAIKHKNKVKLSDSELADNFSRNLRLTSPSVVESSSIKTNKTNKEEKERNIDSVGELIGAYRCVRQEIIAGLSAPEIQQFTLVDVR